MDYAKQRRLEQAMKSLSESDKEHLTTQVELIIENGMHHKIEGLLRDIGQRNFRADAVAAAMEDSDNQVKHGQFLYDVLFQFAAFEYLIEIEENKTEGKQDDN